MYSKNSKSGWHMAKLLTGYNKGEGGKSNIVSAIHDKNGEIRRGTEKDKVIAEFFKDTHGGDRTEESIPFPNLQNCYKDILPMMMKQLRRNKATNGNGIGWNMFKTHPKCLEKSQTNII